MKLCAMFQETAACTPAEISYSGMYTATKEATEGLYYSLIHFTFADSTLLDVREALAQECSLKRNTTR